MNPIVSNLMLVIIIGSLFCMLIGIVVTAIRIVRLTSRKHALEDKIRAELEMKAKSKDT